MLLPTQIVSMSVISPTISKCPINPNYPIQYDHRQVANLLKKAGFLLFTAPPAYSLAQASRHTYSTDLFMNLRIAFSERKANQPYSGRTTTGMCGCRKPKAVGNRTMPLLELSRDLVPSAFEFGDVLRQNRTV